MPSTPDRDPLQASFDKFTMPGDIPDARGDEEARGYATAHPAGRGWVPEPRHEAPPNEGAPGTVIYDGCEHSFPFGVPEDIAAACGESAVFTRERRVRFIDNLACKGNVRAAAALAGVSHETAYRARRQDARFADLWEAALVHARAYAESVLTTRALDGIEVAIVYRGEITGYVTRHDPRLLLAHLSRLDKRVEQDDDARDRAKHFDALLAEYAGHAMPEGFDCATALSPDWREHGPELPPTREDYVAWCRDREAGTGSRKTEDARMAAAGEAGGARWDAWREAGIALVEGILRQAQDERAGEERASASSARAQSETPPPSARPEPVEGPLEFKSAQTPGKSVALNRVTSVNPARRLSRQLHCGAAFGSPYSARVMA